MSQLIKKFYGLLGSFFFFGQVLKRRSHPEGGGDVG